ncbi:MAG: bestrophin family ion channel [Saprospiraceae bacterium]|nr:bestrophin family ion channel [Saprospiraceae bacterium]
MIISKSVSFFRILQWSWFNIVTIISLTTIVLGLYHFEIVSIQLPWLPISVIGTAVAFFIGFKNNQAYDRMWEARKIWGGIVNNSRTWGMQVDGYITNLFNAGVSEEELKQIKQRLIYRHIAWLYTHRTQLLIPTNWEFAGQTGRLKRMANNFQEKFGIGLVKEEVSAIDLNKLIPVEEHTRLTGAKNQATQLINGQSKDLAILRSRQVIEDFRHVELMETLSQFYELQGKNERIKKFPLPRQYANAGNYFTKIFLFLLPFSLVPELISIGTVGLWLAVPITSLVSWVYITMESTGDYSENPFQGMGNDIPMLSLCRTIEIDLRQMLDESDLPAPIQAKKDILM